MAEISRTALASSLLLLALTARGSAANVEIPFSVTESAGVRRHAAPITGGLPVPENSLLFGEVFSRRSDGGYDHAFSLFRKDGKRLPCQVAPLVVKPDGTVRWILVDFCDDLAAGAVQDYVLRVGGQKVRPEFRPALSVRREKSGVVVETGVLSFCVGTVGSFRPLAWVRCRGKHAVSGSQVILVRMKGKKSWDDPTPFQAVTLHAGAPEKVFLAYLGPYRVTIEVRGKFTGDAAGAGYKAWITAWAGSTRVHLLYKVCNSNPEQYTALLVKRSAVELQLASPPRQALFGTDKPLAVDLEKGGCRLVQGLKDFDRYQEIPTASRLIQKGRTLWVGRRSDGWVVLKGGASVFICDRTFATDPARALSIQGAKISLEGISEAFPGVPDRKFGKGPVGRPWATEEGRWIYDCSHHSSEYTFDFNVPQSGPAAVRLARACRSRLYVLASGSYYSACNALGIGRFGTLEDEKACYARWGWKWRPKQLPDPPQVESDYFVAWEDNHYESEADSVEALLLMYLRTGKRAWFDMAEGWARYHKDLQAWRTDGWRWKDGAIWFPSGGPQGNRPVRRKWSLSWGASWGKRAASPICRDLWHLAQGKSCYCHFYGAGLADWYCLTGDRDALEACIDNVEQKDNEFRGFRNFTPGKSVIGSIRGFGRGFYVAVRIHNVVPGDAFVSDLCKLCAETLWRSPTLDVRGFHPSRVGGGFGGMPLKSLTPRMRKWMAERGIKYKTVGGTVDSLQKDGRSWKVVCFGGTWQHVYIQHAADCYARAFGDENMEDFVVGFAQMSAKYMLSPKCHQTWYYTYFDVPDLGMVWDPWAFEHTDTKDGEGCVHSGWYTRFYPDACALGYRWTGEKSFLERAREFWYYGSKRGYRTRHLRGGPNEVGMFASHRPPKDDQVLSTCRLFYEAAHMRSERRPPQAVQDLKVRVEGNKALVTFTAPADSKGGTVARYRLKCSPLPIVPYAEFDYAADAGKRTPWWRADNVSGEPAPQVPGSRECFKVEGVPEGARYFVLCSYDSAGNRSALSNQAVAR